MLLSEQVHNNRSLTKRALAWGLQQKEHFEINVTLLAIFFVLLALLLSCISLWKQKNGLPGSVASAASKESNEFLWTSDSSVF